MTGSLIFTIKAIKRLREAVIHTLGPLVVLPIQFPRVGKFGPIF
jgi:hypothetical protein